MVLISVNVTVPLFSTVIVYTIASPTAVTVATPPLCTLVKLKSINPIPISQERSISLEVSVVTSVRNVLLTSESRLISPVAFFGESTYPVGNVKVT